MKMDKKAGRPKGSKNIATAEIREKFKELVETNLSKFKDDIDSLEPMERLTIIMQMAKFILPTLKAMDLNAPDDRAITIEFREFNIPDIGGDRKKLMN